MRKTRSLEQWRSIIEAQQSSDLTITEYCQQNTLSKTAYSHDFDHRFSSALIA